MKNNLTILKQSGNAYLGYEMQDVDYIKIERGIDTKYEENCDCQKVYLSFEHIERIYNEMKKLQDELKEK